MRLIGIEALEQALTAVAAEQPRVVASGNHAAPHTLLDALERSLERYRLFMLAAPAPLPARDGVIFETPFVGPGMRDSGERLDYLPMRLSLVPRLFDTLRPPETGASRWGSRSTSCRPPSNGSGHAVASSLRS